MLTSPMPMRGGSNTTVNLAGIVNTHGGAVAERNADEEDNDDDTHGGNKCVANDDDGGSSFFETNLD